MANKVFDRVGLSPLGGDGTLIPVVGQRSTYLRLSFLHFLVTIRPSKSKLRQKKINNYKLLEI